MLEVGPEHVFSRNKIARGHHLFAQANSLAVAVINDELALTTKSEIKFTRQVKESERVIAKATVKGQNNKGLTIVKVDSYVNQERSEEHTSELQSRGHLVCRLLLEK